MNFDEVARASALIARRKEMTDLLAIVQRKFCGALLVVKGPSDDEMVNNQLALEQSEAMAVLSGRIAEIDAQLTKLCVYPPPIAIPVADAAA